MSISNLTVDNSLKLKAGSLDVPEGVSAGSVTIKGTFDSDGDLTGNPGLNFGSTGEAFIRGNDEIRFGSNGGSAGCRFFFNANGTTCSATFNGTVTANNVSLGSTGVSPSHLPVAGGTASWSGGGTSLAVSAPGVLSSDLVIVTPLAPSDQASAVLSHAIPSANTVTIHLEGADTTNTSSHHYIVYRAVE